MPRPSTGHPAVLGSSPDPPTGVGATGLAEADDHVTRLLETVSALTAAQAEQGRDLARLLDVLERLTAAHEDTLYTLAQLQARLAELEVRAAGPSAEGDRDPPEHG
jgi:hypothetical protein